MQADDVVVVLSKNVGIIFITCLPRYVAESVCMAVPVYRVGYSQELFTLALKVSRKMMDVVIRRDCILAASVLGCASYRKISVGTRLSFL